MDMVELALLMSLMAAAEPAEPEEPEKPVTGIIVDATMVTVQHSRYPKLLDPERKTVYPTPKLVDDAEYTGFEGFKVSLEEARKDEERVGKEPLIVRPVSADDEDPAGGSMLLSAEDARRLRELNAERGLLDDDRIVIVLGLAVLRHVPEAGAKGVARNVIVEIFFSKNLRRETIDPALSLQDSSGRRLAVQTAYQRGPRRLQVKPRELLTDGETYTLTLASSLQADGRARLGADYSFAFTVGSGDRDDTPSDPDDADDTKQGGA